MTIRMRAVAASVALAAAALAGCETMTAEQCAGADWRGLGFQDAAQGGADRYADRAQSCAEKGFTPDGRAYSEGFAEGMFQFCQPPNGFLFARRGGTFNGSCPPELQYDFAAAYADGRRVHEAEAEVQTAEAELSNLQTRRRNYDEDIREAEAALAAATTNEDRARIRGDLERYRRERRDMSVDFERAEQRLYYARRRVDDLRYEIGARWAAW